MSKKTEQMYLVQYHDNWADEMDIEGGRVMSKEEKEEYFDSFKATIEGEGFYAYYIGTNEDILYESWSDFKDCFRVKKISLEEAKVLKKLELDEYGMFPL